MPTNRGFDTFFGFLGGAEYFYTHGYQLSNSVTSDLSIPQAYDFWNQTTPSLEYNGTYSSFPYLIQAENILKNRDQKVPLFMYMAYQSTHSPVEIYNDSDLLLYSNQQNPFRKNYSALVTQLDRDFGHLMDLLKKYEIYNESIIIFTGDNGGEVRAGGNNYPLRGAKGTLYEGGSRAAAFIHSPLLNETGYTYNGMIHAVDWFSTIVELAEGKRDKNQDGINVWNEIIKNEASLRKEFVYKLLVNSKGELEGAIRDKQWKLIFGDAHLPSEHVKPDNVTGTLFYTCPGLPNSDPNPLPYQLYNIDDDPLENNDLAETNPEIVNRLLKKVDKYKQEMVASTDRPNNLTKYMSLTTDLKILNTNWCNAIEKVTPLY